jgi:hypothetical protein
MKKELIELKNLLLSNEWPEAQYDSQSPEKIVSILFRNSNDKKFLDIHCHSEDLIRNISKKTKLSIGYYSQTSAPNAFLANDFDEVKRKSPFDVILIYEVKYNLEELLLKSKSVLHPQGIIYLRCHPWCARHGSKTSIVTNKAFVHLILSENELQTFGFHVEENNMKIVRPIDTYRKIIASAGLQVLEMDVQRQGVEKFFENNALIRNRLESAIPTGKFPSDQMCQCFVDYIIR